MSDPVVLAVGLSLVGLAGRMVSLQFRLSREQARTRGLVKALRPVRPGSLVVYYRADGATFVWLTVPQSLGGVSSEA
jgi:hypothetical protein